MEGHEKANVIKYPWWHLSDWYIDVLCKTLSTSPYYANFHKKILRESE